MCGPKFSPPLGGYQRARRLGRTARVGLVVREGATLGSKRAPDENVWCATSSPALGVGSVLDFGHSARRAVVSCCHLHFLGDIHMIRSHEQFLES